MCIFTYNFIPRCLPKKNIPHNNYSYWCIYNSQELETIQNATYKIWLPTKCNSAQQERDTTMWTNLKNIVLIKRSQTEKTIYYMIPLRRNV